MRRHQLRVALCAFVVLAMSACGAGDSGDSQSETSSESVANDVAEPTEADTGDDLAPEASAADDAVAFIAAGTASLLDDSSFPGDESQAECFATRLVEIVGIDTLEESGITPDDFMAGSLDNVELSGSQADDLASLLLDDECIPFVEIMLAEATDTDALDGDQLACYSEALSSSETLREGFVASFIGEEMDEEASFELFAELLQLSEDCGLTDFSGDSSSGDFESDADPALLAEYSERCGDGDMDACDLLYWEADYGSDEELFAGTCGGLYDGKLNGSCYMLDEIPDLRIACQDGDDDACNRLYFATGFDTPDNDIGATCGSGTDDSDAGQCGVEEKAAGYRSACEDGDMEACDDLYWMSYSGDENEEFGATCGGRTDGEEGGNCYYYEQTVISLEGCEAGDMEACDDLYYASDIGSEEEEFGATCGGRTDGDDPGGCWLLED